MNSNYCELATVSEYLLIPIKNTVVFPGISLSVEIDRSVDIKELEKAHSGGVPVLAATLKEHASDGERNKDEMYPVATVAFVQQFIRIPGGKCRAMLIGEDRAEITEIMSSPKGYARAVVKRVISNVERLESEAMLKEANAYIGEYMRYMPKSSAFLKKELSDIADIGNFADHAAANLFWSCDEKERILEQIDPKERMELLLTMLEEMLEVLKLQSKLRRDVKARVDKNQKEYYLNEQLKAIRSELGDEGDSDSESDRYVEKINSADMPDAAREKLLKEAQKLRRMPFSSVEYGVICNYLDVCLELPWGKRSEDRVDISVARSVLDRDHDGLEKVKERVIEYLAVKQLSPKLGNQIICLVGPPGTGKTSIARSIAEAMGRNYVRVSLGGVRDEADIRGHRKTYVGAMPGRIVNGLIKAGTCNPLMLLDEIDKLTRDAHGDPASALMEVLDGEQNRTFRDHFTELETDLSEVVFVATANDLGNVPRPLLDRMEVIELKSYSTQEKLGIAKHHLIPKQLERHGLTKKQLKISEAAIKTVINGYTHEAGVRGLERQISAICRKAAQKLVEGAERVDIGVKEVSEFLGAEKVIADRISQENEVGVVNGLAYTELGGSLLKVEVAAMPGTGKLELTGSLGDVMKESARTAITYIRSHADELDVDPQFYKNKDIHFHFPEGAVPKDGPSAGVTMVCALVSELSGVPVKNTVAMTGEVTLRGRVLPIGGLKEKTMAAYKAGVKTVLIPSDNRKDLPDVDPLVREKLTFIPCKAVGDVIKNALAT